MTGAPEQNETVASATRKSVKAGSREKLAQGRRRDEPVWWNEGSRLLKGRHRNAVMEPREATSEEPDRSITSKTWLLRWGTMKTLLQTTHQSLRNVGNVALFLSLRIITITSSMIAGRRRSSCFDTRQLHPHVSQRYRKRRVRNVPDYQRFPPVVIDGRTTTCPCE